MTPDTMSLPQYRVNVFIQTESLCWILSLHTIHNSMLIQIFFLMHTRVKSVLQKGYVILK